MAQDLRVELHFYGKALNGLAIVYYKTAQIPMELPDILFFCLYTLKLFTNKRLSSAALTRIRQRLSLGGELKKVFDKEQGRPFDAPMELREYTILTKSVIRSQIMFRGDDKFSFMLGYSGFGLFGNRRHFDHCAEGSILGLMEKIYLMYEEDAGARSSLFAAASALGEADFNAAQERSLIDMARGIYSGVVQKDRSA